MRKENPSLPELPKQDSESNCHIGLCKIQDWCIDALEKTGSGKTRDGYKSPGKGGEEKNDTANFIDEIENQLKGLTQISECPKSYLDFQQWKLKLCDIINTSDFLNLLERFQYGQPKLDDGQLRKEAENLWKTVNSISQEEADNYKVFGKVDDVRGLVNDLAEMLERKGKILTDLEEQKTDEVSILVEIKKIIEKMEKAKKYICEKPISDFELSDNTKNFLKKINIRTLGDLLNVSEAELLSYEGFGEKSLKEVKDILESKRLHLGMELIETPFVLLEHEVISNKLQTQTKGIGGEENDTQYIFKKTGDFWTVRFGRETKHIENDAGMPYLNILLSRAGENFTTGKFLSEFREKLVVLSDGDETLDKEAKKNYGIELKEINADLEKAISNNDYAEQKTLEENKRKITDELLNATGFAGHGKKLNTEYNNYRLSIGNAIKRAIKKINEHLPELANHLRESIPKPYSSTSLSYRPSEPIDWTL
ncbi:MAG: hypothetical protein JW787_02825 [Sedimentisphaerales bacterium]|nr:hypothetical protein [Sedimentisphaerales bacterium]